MRRGVSELHGDLYQGQFDILKNETHDGVKDTARRTHPNGYERMLAVMEQAVKAPVHGYVLSSSHNWINNKIKKGVCHFLVIDGKLITSRSPNDLDAFNKNMVDEFAR